MPIVLVATAWVVCLLIGSPVHAASYRELSWPLPDGRAMGYAISVPDEAASSARPLVLALHPGGERMPRYGSMFAKSIVLQAVSDLKAIVVAPDCPTERWSDRGAEEAVMGLLQQVTKEHQIDKKRVLVVGFSMGGRGTWFFSSRHPELFTGAIPMAASIGDEPVESMATIPTYVIHSRADTVVPFAPAEKHARALEALGRQIYFEPLDGLSHFSMGGYVPALQRAVRWMTERWAK